MSFGLILFLIIVTAASILWGRINRIGYSSFITSIVHFLMKYSKTNAELVRICLMWFLYMFSGTAISVTLMLAYQENLLRYLTLDPKYFMLVPLAFIAQNSLTGLIMHLLIVEKQPMSVFLEITNIPWVKYTLMMPGIMRMISPLGAAIVEEVFFRGVVFLILIDKFPEVGIYFPILVCTVLFVLQQVLQTDTVGQGTILLVGSMSISIVGCIATLATGSFLPTLLCHAAYAVFYFQLGTSMPKSSPKTQRPSQGSAQPNF